MIEKKLLGKKVVSIDAGPYTWGIVFEDGSGMEVNTKMEVALVSLLGEMVVTAVNSAAEKLELCLGKQSHIHILLDEELLTGPEAFYFQDIDGTMIVENGN